MIHCFNCSQFGHMKHDWQKSIHPAGSCFVCFSAVHLYDDCIHRRNGNVVDSVFPQDCIIEVLYSKQTVSMVYILMGTKCLRMSKHLLLISVPQLDLLSPTAYFGVGNCNLPWKFVWKGNQDLREVIDVGIFR